MARNGAAPTWPSWAPFRAIDHVLVTPDLAVLDSRVVHTRASDHRLLGISVESAARRAA